MESFGTVGLLAPPYLLQEGDEYIGEIRVGESGFTVQCDYDTALKTARAEARKAGANLMVIVEHRVPGLWSTCHRLRCKLYRVVNPEAYEEEIEWMAGRKLAIGNFLADTTERSFQAVASSGISVDYIGIPEIGKFTVATTSIFYPRSSYFKRSNRDEEVLHHEQLHFDITELYARKFIADIVQDSFLRRSVVSDINYRFKTLNTEWRDYQDKYDSEVYADESLQTVWGERVGRQLDSLATYANRRVTVKF